ncbi:MAG: GNAT family N-acetyltransferase [Spirochaetales bacterium]|nr:GNAT family N-acetyltransferase [Spirochaetales bacterium]
MNSKHSLKNGMEYIIREARPDDSDQLLGFLEAVAEESDNLTFGPGEFTMTLEQEAEFIKKAVSADNQLFIVADFGGVIIGNLSFKGGIKPRTAHSGEFGVSVRKKYWNNGIARALIVHLLDWAAGAGITKVNLQVREDNHAAISLYAILGFEIEGSQLRTFFINGEYFNTLHMGKIIE